MAVKSCHETVVRFRCPVGVVADWFNTIDPLKSLRVLPGLDFDSSYESLTLGLGQHRSSLLTLASVTRLIKACSKR